VIRGTTRNTLMSTVALNSAAATCRIDLDKLQFSRPKATNELTNNGFIRK